MLTIEEIEDQQGKAVYQRLGKPCIIIEVSEVPAPPYVLLDD